MMNSKIHQVVSYSIELLVNKQGTNVLITKNKSQSINDTILFWLMRIPHKPNRE